MQNEGNESNSTSNSQDRRLALPPVLISMPAIGAGILVSVLAFTTPSAAALLPQMLVALYVYWLFCVWQIHRVLAKRTQGTYGVKPLLALLANIAGGPLAPYLASFILGFVCRGLVSFADIAGSMFPRSQAIATNASDLANQYCMQLTVLLACVLVAWTQIHLGQSLQGYICQRQTCSRIDRSKLSAAIVSACLLVPGCLWLLGSEPFANLIGPSENWQAYLALVSFMCGLPAFLILGWLNRRLSAALTMS